MANHEAGTMTYPKYSGALALAVAFAASMGCGEVSSPGSVGNGGTSAGTSGASGASAGRAGQGGSGGAPDAGGEEPSDGGSRAGRSGSGGSSGGPSVPAGCPVPAPVAVAGQTLAIQSIKFSDENDPEGSPAEIVIRNVSTSDVTIVGGRDGWQWCNVPAYWALTEGQNVTLSPGETYFFIPYYNLGGPRPLFRGDDNQDTNEMGIYPTTGSFDEADKILAFVEWGEGSFGDSRQSIAVMAGLWTFGETVTIGPSDAGFVATGATNRGSGYTGVPARCLVAPPNE
jgi:hypothetical protein